ncbi:MAG TPA: sodium:proton antiporter [Spirochaetota bacterium]|nr:sodium:proton antiporter [Spirochaetota bacterium]HPF05563.1 sodium:proton antiporter [Spirochaetota bacterium]HPJ41526.1 sodium:proton antiporter [Spirochaetota bacterium]HPR36888.1 sodium:proton antiporter [Spirochaetota bacterium]HRX47414.1 sodium:proton antiporter [Spirochaetota bacterium]
MKKVIIFSLLLIAGLTGSQILPGLIGSSYTSVSEIISILTLIALSFIMIHVGYEFEIEKDKLRSYGWDYLVAMTAAAFPWIFVALYFIYIMLPAEQWINWDAWKEVMLASRFAAPTSAGVLFSMLAAAGLASTWMYRKTRVLAIFDDLDTVLLMIPLKMMIVGLAWQLGFAVVVMLVFLWLAWRYMHLLSLPVKWNWFLFYSAGIVLVTEVVYYLTKSIDPDVPIHIEVLLPAFVLGVMLKYPENKEPHDHETDIEHRVSTIVSAVFMILVGLNMPLIFGESPGSSASSAITITGSQPAMNAGTIAFHVFAVTVISNLGKMFPAFVYRKEAHWRERLAIAIGMWPRGEVGAGIIIISLGYGIGGPVVTVAVLSLALNLLLTGVFIWIVKYLLSGVPVTDSPV